MVKFRVVRTFGKGIDKTTHKAYRVETVELLTESEAFKLMEELDSPYQGRKYENQPQEKYLLGGPEWKH